MCVCVCATLYDLVSVYASVCLCADFTFSFSHRFSTHKTQAEQEPFFNLQIFPHFTLCSSYALPTYSLVSLLRLYLTYLACGRMAVWLFFLLLGKNGITLTTLPPPPSPSPIPTKQQQQQHSSSCFMLQTLPAFLSVYNKLDTGINR